MEITKQDVEHIAMLARLNLREDEIDLFVAQLSNILSYVVNLNELDTTVVEPTSHVLSLSNIMRNDTPGISLQQDTALMNAPDHTDSFYRVPKIIE
jgi:aspartyl-tRNA(Asn)/glutamyl-tRNA(Gln) amidotransferase subunit C